MGAADDAVPEGTACMNSSRPSRTAATPDDRRGAGGLGSDSGTQSRAESAAGQNGRLTYVLDTSVLLSDPRAMLRFAEHDVVLPVVVITELEAKRHHPELGYFARPALRLPR